MTFHASVDAGSAVDRQPCLLDSRYIFDLEMNTVKND